MTNLHEATSAASERLQAARARFSRSHDVAGRPDELAVAERNTAEAVLAALVDVGGHVISADCPCEPVVETVDARNPVLGEIVEFVARRGDKDGPEFVEPAIVTQVLYRWPAPRATLVVFTAAGGVEPAIAVWHESAAADSKNFLTGQVDLARFRFIS